MEQPSDKATVPWTCKSCGTVHPVTIVITMEGGLIQDIEKPEGIKVVVMDFDADTVDYCDPDDDIKVNAKGERYFESIW